MQPEPASRWHGSCVWRSDVKVVIALVVAASAIAQAQPAPEAGGPPADAGVPVDATPTPPPPDAPATPAEIQAPTTDTSDAVHGAPRPGLESGRLDPIDTGDGTWRLIGRGVLWIPRIPFELVTLPVRGIVYLGDRYNAVRTFTEIFTTDDHKLALYPTAAIATEFGVNVGLRGRIKDVFGGRESLRVSAAFGGEYRWTAASGLDSGTLLGRVRLALDGVYANRDRERFSGYGNVDEVSAPAMPIDPLDGGAVESRYRIKVARVAASVRVEIAGGLAVIGTSALVDKEYGADSPNTSQPDLGDIYLTEMLPGFPTGTRFSYNEIEVAYDTRRRADIWDAPGVRGTGTFAAAYLGHQHALDSGPNFFRVGVDLQRYVRIWRGPRALQLRLWGEAVTGPRDEVPFSEVPRLGGQDLLRGYGIDRFRDRAAVVAQVGYTWTASRHVAPVLFVDAGRVFTGFDDLSFEDPRVGFGAALEIYSARGLMIRGQIASSIDGDVFLYFAFNQAYDAQARVKRF